MTVNEDYLSNLNNEQREAITHGDGPLLIIAGAGSGKTRVLTSRIAYLIREKNVNPASIMAVTFTNKAAKEMKERITNILGEVYNSMWVGTFHSICMRILRIDGEVMGLNRNFVIYDSDDQKSVIKTIIKRMGIDEKELSPYFVSSQISAAKSKLMGAYAYEEMATSQLEELAAKVFIKYEEELKSNSALDFDDLLFYTVELFNTYPEKLEKYRTRFQNILVDEYQDTNEAQYHFLRLLSDETSNIFVVGDPDQSIYAFRGAKIENILSFSKDYPTSKVVRLEQNYRSTEAILSSANELIGYNTERPEKTLWTSKTGGEPISIKQLPDERGEASWLLENISYLVNYKNYSLKDIAIFYRTHAQSRVIEDKLMHHHISYKVYGGMKFYDRKEIKDIIAYLRAALNPHDNVSLMRIINEPRRGIGDTTLGKMANTAVAHDISYWEVMNNLEDCTDLRANTLKAIEHFVSLIKDFNARSTKMSVSDFVRYIWRESGYKTSLEQVDTVENQNRLENMSEFLTITQEFDEKYHDGEPQTNDDEVEYASPLAQFLANISLSSDLDDLDESDYVSMMSIHMAKGLEFPVVFLVGLEENIFPHVMSLNSMQESEIEEERRLCYVGMTRAKERLYVTYNYSHKIWGRTMFNKPSRFINQMKTDVMNKAHSDAKAKAEISSKSTGTKIGESAMNKFAHGDNHFVLGDKVLHRKFGRGVIVSVTGVGADAKVKVAFEDMGIKELILVYANLIKAN